VAVLVAAAAAALVDWAAVGLGRRRVERAAKPLALGLLLVVALTLEPADVAQRAWFVAALVAALAGDVFLMLPTSEGQDPRDADLSGAVPPAFMAGLVAFLLAHLAYVTGFVVAGVVAGGVVAGVGVVVVAGGTVGRIVLRAAAERGGRGLAVALSAYLVVIGALVAAAYGSGRPSAIVGATLFFVSDAVLGWDRFVRPLRWAPVGIMATYHLGQAGLVLSLLG
jgi:uncharacterized membrane protein YhhN